MRQRRIDPEQRAELAASKPAAAIEELRPFTVKQGQYLAFIYYYSKIHGMPPAEADFQRYFSSHTACSASDDQDAPHARIHRPGTCQYTTYPVGPAS
jgi:hypothetical protein